MLQSQALETLCWTYWTWPGPAPKIPKTSFSATFSGTRWTWLGFAPKPPKPSPEPSPEPYWTWPGSAPKPPGTFSGNFSGTLLNLTWLCTKASQTFTGTFSGTLLNLTWLYTLLNLTWLCTKASQTFSGTPEPCWTWPLCAKASQSFSGTFGTFSGTSLNLTRRLHQSTLELFWAEDPISLRCWGKMVSKFPEPLQEPTKYTEYVIKHGFLWIWSWTSG